MSIGASLLRGVYRLSGVKKAFALPEEQLLKAIEKANRGRGFFMPLTARPTTKSGRSTAFRA